MTFVRLGPVTDRSTEDQTIDSRGAHREIPYRPAREQPHPSGQRPRARGGRLGPSPGRSRLPRIAATIDGLGYDAITTSEHLAMPYEEVPRLGPYWMHALSVMAFVSGATKRVRVDASVLVLPYYHPLAFAKALSTIDVLSGGRLDVSIGVGHAMREFEALGVPFAERRSDHRRGSWRQRSSYGARISLRSTAPTSTSRAWPSSPSPSSRPDPPST